MKAPVILPLAMLFSAAPIARAAITTITFESPDYTTASPLSTGTGVTTNRTFDGQQGWSQSTSSHAGQIITTTTSGSYTGGQGLTANTSSATDQTYIGAKASGAFDSFVFDFRYQVKELGLGGWNDDDADSLFDQSEAEFMAGTVTISTTTSFGLRAAGFGTRLSTGTSGTAGNWYRMTVTPDFANLQVTLGVFNLTSNSAVSLASSVFTLTGAEFGVNPTAYEGITARVTSNSGAVATLDNIHLIPEPATALLGGLGMLAMLRRRR